MIVAWMLLVAPYLIMMPGMGMGIAGLSGLKRHWLELGIT
jgi:hypothetical protein